MLAKEGTKLFLLLHVSCVAETVHSSNVRLGSAGVATLVLEQVPLFSGDVILIGISCCCPPETEILTLDTCILDTVCITTSSTSLHSYGGEQYIWLPGVTRLDARYSITHDIAAIHIHVLVMDKFWMIDRCHSVLRLHATQANSTPTVVTGRHITPQVFPSKSNLFI